MHQRKTLQAIGVLKITVLTSSVSPRDSTAADLRQKDSIIIIVLLLF